MREDYIFFIVCFAFISGLCVAVLYEEQMYLDKGYVKAEYISVDCKCRGVE